MSYVARMFGEVMFDTEENFNQAKEILENAGWLEEFNIEKSEEADWVAKLVLERSTVRNLGRHTDDILTKASDGFFIGVTNDVSWEGFYDTTGEYAEYDLEGWIRENTNLHRHKPEESNYEDESDYYDNFVEWQTDCEERFFAEIAPRLL